MRTILIVDDEKIEREGVKRLIRRELEEVRLIEAVNGRQGLELAKTEKPDLVFSDIKMPFLTGLELAEKIHEDAPEIPIVIFTGYSDFEFARRAMKNGVLDYLLKPIDPKEFRETFHRVLNMIEDRDRQIAAFLKEKEQELPEEKLLRYEEKEQANHTGALSDVEKVKQYIYEHYAEELSVDILRQHVYLSAGYMSYIFKKETGVGLSQFIRTYRLEKAKQLLETTNKKIVQICSETGFTNASYFCKNFREYYGVSPEKFRKGTDSDEDTK